MRADQRHKSVTVFSVFIVGIVILTLAYVGRKYPPLANDGMFENIIFTGEMSTDGGPWEPLDLDNGFNLNERHTYRFRGHFLREIEENQQIMVRIGDLRTRITINGEPVFCFGEGETHSPGNTWQFFTSPGITTGDDVEIELYNYYTKVHPFSVSQFLTNIYAGSVDGLYKLQFRRNGVAMLIGFLIFSVGILEGIAALAMAVMKQEGVGRAFYCAGFAVSSGIWFSIQFDISTLILPYPVLVGTADVLSAYMMSAFFSLYIVTYLTGRRKGFGYFNSIVTLSALGMVSILVLWGERDAYHTVSAGWALASANLASSIFYIGWEYYKERSPAIRVFGLSLLPIFFGSMLDVVGFWSGWMNETMWLRGCFLLFVLIQLTALLWQVKEKYRKAEEVQRVENEILQNRISITISQIQPHFLFNVLTAIAELCGKNPKEAEKATLDFAFYLRGNLDSLGKTDPISFEKELQHIQTYLSLEKMRFGEELNVVYDIRTTDFLLPALTIQPLVENSVKYGIGKKEEGGTITISSRETATEYLVTVSDDGNGFDPGRMPNDGRSHTGIDNVKSRLMTQCKGSLQMESQIGSGTTAIVRLPKAEQERENT